MFLLGLGLSVRAAWLKSEESNGTQSVREWKVGSTSWIKF